MGRQSRLVLQCLLSLAVLQVTFGKTSNTIEISSTEPEIGSGVKISTPKWVQPATKNATATPINAEIINDLIEASKHNAVLADDPRFNKMLPDTLKTEKSLHENTSSHGSSDEYYAYDNYDDYSNYEDDYNEDLAKKTNKKTSKTVADSSAKKDSINMKPIKENKDSSSVEMNKLEDHKLPTVLIQDNEVSKKKDQHKNDVVAEEDEDDDDLEEDEEDEDEDDDDEDDDDALEEDVVFSQNVPCPRYCVCTRNVNSFLVATCSRFDPETQKFGADITDLIVSDVGPKYPILLGPEFFLQIGLKHVSSIKISNCTIEYLHPDAFHGLDDLFSVNLTNVGLAVINPETFAKNKKLRLLTISGNELSVMSSLKYILKSSSIEELDLSRNNLLDLNPNAFSELTNVVYINLSQNKLQKIPKTVFDNVETLEELDLSYNTLTSLPAGIFNHTSLAILHLKYNAFTNDLSFGFKELQQLDLSFNSINAVHHGMFDKMTGLTNLNLRGNGITKINTDSFLTLRDLRHIDLSVNELDQVSSMLFYKNSELDVIRLNDNPRLTRLPTDGFECYNGYFTVYFLDLSNCAIGALGHKTFSTMPHLATLKLSWNNINNLDFDTFGSLFKLNDLDLSNNLITRLEDNIFMNNSEISKLNLAGNTIRKLSTHLFMPITKLRELDVSDCELSSLLSDNELAPKPHKFRFFETLRIFNASANQIKQISSADVKNFKNLHTLDVSRNPLKCNEQFQDFITYVSLNGVISPNPQPMLSNIVEEAAAATEVSETHRDWAKLAMEVCKHHENFNYKTKTVNIVKDTDAKKKTLQSLEEVDDKIVLDEKYLQSMMDKSRTRPSIRRIMKGKGNADKPEIEKPQLNLVDDAKEEDESDYDDEDDDLKADDVAKDDDDDNDDDDDDYYDLYDNVDKKKKLVNEEKKIIDHGVKVEEILLHEETTDKFLLNKFLLDGDDKSDEDYQEEEIIIERGRIYYSGYKFLIPIVVIVTGVLALLLVLAKIITLVMRKRGERYRMALLAASKNSIVYQKLSEDIKPPTKAPKQPKVHRYVPIEQV